MICCIYHILMWFEPCNIFFHKVSQILEVDVQEQITEFCFDICKVKSESEVAQSCPTLCNPWTVAYQASQSMGFSRQEYQSGLPFPSPGDFPAPGIEPGSPALQADALPSEPAGKPFYICAFSYVAGNLEQDEDSSSTMETVH